MRKMMDSEFTLIGMDIGGTNARAGLVVNGKIIKLETTSLKSQGTVQEGLDQIFGLIEQVLTPEVTGIGIAFPSIMDVEQGIVYDVQNIPNWKRVELKAILEERFELPVRLNNDANCFALGEYYFGQGKDYNTLVGLITGTGVGGGIVINGKIHSGANGGAGEFGMVPYRDKYIEYYASGQFFTNHDNRSGEQLNKLAQAGDETALRLYNEYGFHLAQAIKTVQYAIDPEIIILGGSVRKSYPLYQQAMWKAIDHFAFSHSRPNIRIALSEDDYIAILGAAALHIK